MELPTALFDSVLSVLVVYHMYSLTINWLGDLAAFRLWYTESSIWSDFGGDMRLAKMNPIKKWSRIDQYRYVACTEMPFALFS